MTDRPLVSVITPTYNMGDRLPACVASVSAQTYPHVEHVVVDGGSSDGTVGFLRSQPAVRWVSEPDRGQSDAINKGLAMAEGEVLTWLNADDLLRPEGVQTVVDALRAHPGAGWVYGDLEIVRGSERWVTRPPPRLSAATFRRGNVIFQPGTFFTAAALRQVGGIDEEFHLAMDFDLWLRFVDAGIAAVYVPVPLATFEVHAESKTGSAGGRSFALEEFRAQVKRGRPHDGAMSVDRWYWDDTLWSLLDLLEAGKDSEAQQLARAALPRMDPVVSRQRAFLWAARLSPRLARSLSRLKRSRRV